MEVGESRCSFGRDDRDRLRFVQGLFLCTYEFVHDNVLLDLVEKEVAHGSSLSLKMREFFSAVWLLEIGLFFKFIYKESTLLISLILSRPKFFHLAL